MTINMLLGFLRPTEGSATVLGHDAAGQSRAVRQRTGLLPEGFELYENLTGREHVVSAIDTKDADDDPDHLVERVGLDPEAARRRAGGYSKGMTQRLALAVALVGFLVALATFVNAPDAVMFAKFAGVSLLFAFAFVGVYVGISAVTATRSRAMLGVFGAYFVLVPFWFGFLPVISLTELLGTAADLVGANLSQNTTQFVQALSPATAYLYSTEIVYQSVLPNPTYQGMTATFTDLPDEIYRQFWFNAVVMFAWGAGSMLLGYLSFRRSELG